MLGHVENSKMSDNSIKIKGSYSLNYARDFIWAKLNDPDILAACIRGCAYVERETAQNFKAVIRASLGGLKKDFEINLEVDDGNAPEQYCLSTIVSTGLLGKATGEADVSLNAITASKTELNYIATITGGGMLGKALPLVESLAANRVQAFFDAFVDHLNT